MNKNIYLLYVWNECDDKELLGVYSALESAQNAREKFFNILRNDVGDIKVTYYKSNKTFSKATVETENTLFNVTISLSEINKLDEEVIFEITKFVNF